MCNTHVPNLPTFFSGRKKGVLFTPLRFLTMEPAVVSMEDGMDELTKPIKVVEEKWKMLPHFLRMRGLLRQHIDSYDNFINVELKNIINAKSNRVV